MKNRTQQIRKEENKQASKTNDSNKEKQDNKNENKSTSVTQLSEKKKLALAFYADEADQYMLTKNEILTGIYEYKKGSEVEKKQMEDLMLESGFYKNAPDGMKFYQVYPTKGQFASVIGVNKNKIFIGGTQGALNDYASLSKDGKELDINQLYKANKDNRSLPEMEKKIQIVDSGAAQKQMIQIKTLLIRWHI